MGWCGWRFCLIHIGILYGERIDGLVGIVEALRLPCNHETEQSGPLGEGWVVGGGWCLGYDSEFRHLRISDSRS